MVFIRKYIINFGNFYDRYDKKLKFNLKKKTYFAQLFKKKLRLKLN